MSIARAACCGLASLLASTAALADVPQVAADIAPVHSLVSRVMAGVGEPALIVPSGASPHGYALRPSEARQVQEADAVFWIGPALAPWMEEAIATLAPAAASVPLLEVEGTTVLEFRTGATFADDHDHDDDHGHDHDDDHGDADHSEDDHAHAHDGVDPHAWLDPVNALAWLDAIAETLAGLDPDNAAAYRANAEAGRAEIDAAMAEAAARLQPVSDLRFVVFHDAYHYYEARFGLSAIGAIELADASDPSPARIEEVRTAVLELGVGCVFSEPQFNQGLVETVTEGTEARTGVIDPLGSRVPTGPDFYPSLLLAIADEIVACAG